MGEAMLLYRSLSKNHLLFLSLLFTTTTIFGHAKTKKDKVRKKNVVEIQETSPFYKVSQEYLKSLSLPETDVTDEDDDKKKKKTVTLVIPEVPVYTQSTTLYSLYGTVPVTASNVLSKNGSKDLEIECGDHKVEANLVNYIDNTQTLFGKIYLTYLVATPIDDIEKLQARQAAIKECIDPKVYSRLKKALDFVKTVENTFLYLWQEESEFNFKAINAFYFSNSLPVLNKLRHANTNPYLMELLCLKGRLTSLGISLSIPAIHFALKRIAYQEIEHRVALDQYVKSDPCKELIKGLNNAAEKNNSLFYEIHKAWEVTPTDVENMSLGENINYALTKYLSDNSSEGMLGLCFANAFITKKMKLACAGDTALLQLIDKNSSYYASLMHPNKKALTSVLNFQIPWVRNVKNGSKEGLIQHPQDPKKDISPFDFLWRHEDSLQLTWGDYHKLAYEKAKIYTKNEGWGPFAKEMTPFWAGSGMYFGMEGITGWFAYTREKNYNDLTNYLHTQMIAAGTVIRAMKSLNEAIERNPHLFNGLEHKHHLTALFKDKDKSVSQKLHQLTNLLLTNTFTDQPSYFSLKGRVLAAYALMKQIKNELAPALVALGEVDALLSCATLYKESLKNNNHYVFATYVEQDTPYINTVNMWNPFVGPHKSVVNSVELGGKNPQNMILTGPNAGGKSTFSKGLTLEVVLAQTIGLVPAESFAITPFAKINTYMNISDDTAGGNSLFKSEVMRAQELLKTILDLPKNQFSFSVMDEMFSGTSPKEGEAAGYAVAKNIGSHKHSIAIIATHFPRLKKLEEETTDFKNYQVRVVKNADGTLTYPFKLELGAADQNVALDILKLEGFDGSIMTDAYAILAESNQPTAAA